MKFSGEQGGFQHAKNLALRLRSTGVIIGIVTMALILGSMMVDVHFLPHHTGEARVAVAPKLKGIENPKNLPMILDFGMGICIPCKMMKPVLEEVAREYDGKLLVRILELDQHRELARQFRVRLIPTQIFVDSKGKIVHRHEGFMDKASIVGVLNRMGIKR